MHRLVGDMKAHPNAWPFLVPVNGEEVVDYYEVIKRPMGPSRPKPSFFRDTPLTNHPCRYKYH